MNRPTPDSSPESPVPDPARARLVAERVRCAPGRLECEIDLHLGPGEVLQIEGPNGSGKTSLLRALCGLTPPESGRVLWDDVDVEDDPLAFRRNLTFIGHSAGLKRDLTARENLESTRAIAGAGGRADLDAALARVGLEDRADIPLRRMSAGQCRRVTLARLLIDAGALWVMDEPFTTLDAAGKLLLESLIVDHCHGGGMVLVTTHQPSDFGGLPVRILALGSAGDPAP